jgi:3-hydroxypropanoate dehydrogenase
MSALSNEATATLFQDARTHSAWLHEPVGDDVLLRAYELAKWGPTSANTCPLRIVFVRSLEAKEKLVSVLMEANRGKTRAAPVTAILCYDLAFYERLPELFPPKPALRSPRGNRPARGMDGVRHALDRHVHARQAEILVEHVSGSAVVGEGDGLARLA